MVTEDNPPVMNNVVTINSFFINAVSNPSSLSLSPPPPPPLVPLMGKQRGQVAFASDSQSGSPEVRVPLWPLAGFVLGRPEFKS